ncbi:ABC transporter substrate-binding protein [Intestinirhabdus alba]|jgi:NitT/TauT family transport system substrate-binding protein|uniref:ABC transporter substrate-binding protein n=1 Tax=Intestinirhabdus alba TaxID=2899544 RepID=A0A6L6INF9_9ENTR|nr:ABC transporter substrate-binding protein [Intestinirhabdus alba]MTH47735.1 ABC transporter substrate-binding protein [Intestinirhabdus alba]
MRFLTAKDRSNRDFSRREVLKIGAAVGALAAFSCPASRAYPLLTAADEDAAWRKEPASGRTINIGFSEGLCIGTLGVAHELGFYADEGLKTQLVRSNTTEIDALGTGKVDASAAHIASMLVPVANGIRAVFTAGVQTGCKSLYVLAASDIRSTRDLAKKTVAIPGGIGNADHNIALRFFIADHVDPLAIKYKVTDPGAAVMAMESGEIQGAILSDQFAKGFVDSGTLRIVRSITFDEDFKHEVCCVHAVSRDLYEQSPITAARLTRAHERAKKWVTANPTETVAMMLKNRWASGDPSLVREMLLTYDFTVDAHTTERTIVRVIDDYKKLGILNSRMDTEKLKNRLWDPMGVGV